MTDHPFGNPDADHQDHDAGAHQPLADDAVTAQILTVEDVLASARLVERTVSICLRADLAAEHDRVLSELGSLVTASGEVIGSDDEDSAGVQTNVSRARELADRLQQLKVEMRAAMWHVRFRAMDSDTWTAFKKQHLPKAKDADLTEFRTRIVAECAIEPPITEDQARAMRKKFNASQFIALSDTAYAACTAGGIDVPKSPNSWANLAQQ